MLKFATLACCVSLSDKKIFCFLVIFGCNDPYRIIVGCNYCFHATESGIAERSQELKNKDDGIAKLEKVIEERSKKIASLQAEIASLQVCNLICSTNYNTLCSVIKK